MEIDYGIKNPIKPTLLNRIIWLITPCAKFFCPCCDSGKESYNCKVCNDFHGLNKEYTRPSKELSMEWYNRWTGKNQIKLRGKKIHPNIFIKYDCR